MERSRATAPASSTAEEVPSPPEGAPSLSALLQAVREPGVIRAEVDALLAGLSRPLAPGQSPRQHADLLLSLIADPHIGSFTGHSGRTVRTVAVRALMDLGYPYALEVPPDALDEAVVDPVPAPALEALPPKAWGGLSLMVVLGLLEMAPVAMTRNTGSSSNGFLLLIAATNILPATVAFAGQALGVRFLQGLGLIWLFVVGILWALLGLIVLFGSPAVGLIPLGIGALTLISTSLLDTRKP